MGLYPRHPERSGKRLSGILSQIQPGDIKAEYLLPTIVDQLIQCGQADVTVLPTHDKWFGVTYKEDKDFVIRSFQELIKAGVYPEKLYN